MNAHLESRTTARVGPSVARRASRRVFVGSVPVGGGAPVTVQSMTDTPTTDVRATVAQILRLQDVGVDIVRVSCPDEASTRALADVVRAVTVPVVADVHFHYERAVESVKAGAACVRINPGNLGGPERVARVVDVARDHGASIRIGVNAASLDRDVLKTHGGPTAAAMADSAVRHAELLDSLNFANYKVSAKASDVARTIDAYERLAVLLDCPLHVGVTEASGSTDGTVKSAIGIGSLLRSGVVDTLRVSLSAPPEDEVRVGFSILRAVGVRRRGVEIVSCPSCARQALDVVRAVRDLERRLAPVTHPVTVALMGCVVNGPGEAREADVAFAGGGNGNGMLYVDGRAIGPTAADVCVDRLVELVEAKAAAAAAAPSSADPPQG